MKIVNRLKKAMKDHVFGRSHDLELRLKLADAPYRMTAVDNGFEFFVIETAEDPRLADIRRDFPKQSRSFDRNLAEGCVLLVLGDSETVMGYFVASPRDLWDRDCYRVTFKVPPNEIYAYNFYVDPIHRTRPVAKVLLTEGFDWLRKAGYTDLTAICRSDLKALFRLYRQFGFRPTGRALDMYTVLHFPISVWTKQRELLPKKA